MQGGARLAAMQAFYQMDISGSSCADILDEFRKRVQVIWQEDGSAILYDEALFTRIITSWNDNIDVYLQQNLTSPRRLERLDVPLRAILRAGASELMSRQSESIGSIIRAYMALADCFYEGRESKLVNAVLDKIAGLDEGRRASLTSEDSPCEDSSCKDSPCEDSSCEDSPCEDSSCEDSSCKDSPCEDSS